MNSKDAMRVGACFTAAALLEVSVWPSPGLVSPHDQGAHSDMNFQTFLLGTAMLAPYYTAFVELGLSHGQRRLPELFGALRRLGVDAETDLLLATSGINTQRGQLFLLGIGAGISGWCLAQGWSVPSSRYYLAVQSACAGLAANELAGLTEAVAKTTGQRLFVKHGLTGARGEAEAGFPTVQQVGYPAFCDGLMRGVSLNDAGVHSLISIMACIDDTTVWGRLGKQGSDTLRQQAGKILSLGSVFTQPGRTEILAAHRLFCHLGLSPGGAADLLALTTALYFVECGFPNAELLLKPSLFQGGS